MWKKTLQYILIYSPVSCFKVKILNIDIKVLFAMLAQTKDMNAYVTTIYNNMLYNELK